MLKKFFSADLFKYNGVSDAQKFRHDYLKILGLSVITVLPLSIALFTYIITGMNIPGSGVEASVVLVTKLVIIYGVINF